MLTAEDTIHDTQGTKEDHRVAEYLCSIRLLVTHSTPTTLTSTQQNTLLGHISCE